MLGYVFVMLCLTQRQSMRFLLIGLGRCRSAWPTWPIAGDSEDAPRAGAGDALVLVLGLEAGLAMTRAGAGVALVTGGESSIDFSPVRADVSRGPLGGHATCRPRPG